MIRKEGRQTNSRVINTEGLGAGCLKGISSEMVKLIQGRNSTVILALYVTHYKTARKNRHRV